jgi:hypothetical protein
MKKKFFFNLFHLISLVVWWFDVWFVTWSVDWVVNLNSWNSLWNKSKTWHVYLIFFFKILKFL